MQCVDCKRLRHVGECEPVYEDYGSSRSPLGQEDLETLRIDAQMAIARYRVAKENTNERAS